MVEVLFDGVEHFCHFSSVKGLKVVRDLGGIAVDPGILELLEIILNGGQVIEAEYMLSLHAEEAAGEKLLCLCVGFGNIGKRADHAAVGHENAVKGTALLGLRLIVLQETLEPLYA